MTETEDQKKFITYVFLVVLRRSYDLKKLTTEIYLQEILLLAYDIKFLYSISEVPIGEEENTDVRLNSSGTH